MYLNPYKNIQDKMFKCSVTDGNVNDNDKQTSQLTFN